MNSYQMVLHRPVETAGVFGNFVCHRLQTDPLPKTPCLASEAWGFQFCDYRKLLGAGGFGAKAAERGAQVLVRIDRGIVDATLVVQVSAGGPSAHPNVANPLSADHGLARHDGEP